MRTTILLTFLLFFCLPQAWAKDTLHLLDSNRQELFAVALQAERSFGIRFVHSVARSPVEEWFKVRRGQIFLEKTIYADFGAGLPHEPEGDQRMQFKDKKIILSGFNLGFKEFDQRVGRIAHHTLLLPGQVPSEIPLQNFVQPGQTVTFTVRTED